MLELPRRVLAAALLVGALAALLTFRGPLEPRSATEPDSELELEFEWPGVLRLYKSGRVERFHDPDAVPPSPAGDPASGVASKDVLLGPAANLSARLYLPVPPAAEPGEKLPVVVFFHGGAFMANTTASPLYHRYAASLAAAAPAVVVSVDYRLAPEHRVPAAYDDALAAIRAVVAACGRGESVSGGAEAEPEPWLAAHGDASRVVLAGDSAGANMAHNAAIRLSKDGIEGSGDGDTLAGIALMHPYFWGKEPLGGEPTDAAFRGALDRAWEVASGGAFGLDHPYINPVASPEEWRQLGCRRVLVVTAEQCWFVERARAYAEGIRKSGWEGELEFLETKGEGHVYFLLKQDGENAVKELAAVADFVRRC
ncbi:hypothetical protein ACP4OV_023901 [Aristida adscensionis]